MNMPRTHPEPPSISRDEARHRTRALVEELRDVLKNEEAWAIAQRHLDAEYDAGFSDGRVI